MSSGAELERLVAIMARLRSPQGCPWDREQDLRSLRPYLLEEAYEVLEEMDRVGEGGPWQPLCEELGDLLFQIVFHAQLAQEQGAFGMAEVSQSISDKLERRHPHVFGAQAQQARESGTGQVLANWARLKAEERKRKTGREGSVLDGVPLEAPALLRAERLTEKASRIGFDWPDLAGVRAKLDEELAELDEAIASGERDAKEHELGDVLFSLANLARFMGTPAEDALRQANRRFTARFHHIEAELHAGGVPFGEASLEQMEAGWQRAKVAEKQAGPPREPSRALLASLEVPVADLARQAAFWNRVGPLLGWHPLAAPPGEALYSDGGLTLRFVPRGAAQGLPQGGGPTLRMLVPTLSPLREALGRAGVALEEGEAGAVCFTDPAGLRCQVSGPSPSGAP